MQIDVSDVMICDAFTVVPSIVNDKKKNTVPLNKNWSCRKYKSTNLKYFRFVRLETKACKQARK
jgi:hypothetical protein